MSTRILSIAFIGLSAWLLWPNSPLTEAEILRKATASLHAADLELGGDEIGASLQLSELRYVGEAATHDGHRHVFFIRLDGQTQQGRPIQVTRVVYLDAGFRLSFLHRIGCGRTDVMLKGERNEILVLGQRQYDLSIEAWRAPLIEQQQFC